MLQFVRTGIFAFASAAAIALGMPPGLAGQVVSGRVVDAASGTGLPTAFVEVLDREDRRLGAGLTDRGGRFHVTLEEAGGPFRLDVNSLSHRGARVDALSLTEGETLDVGDIRLEAAPIPLDGIVAEGRRTSRITLGREAVRQHQLLGRGTFLAGAIIGLDNPSSLAHYIAEATGLWVTPGGASLRDPHSSTRDDCVVLKVNRWPLNRPGMERGEPPIGFRDLNDIPLDWIAAIEIFNDYNDVPDLYASDAILDGGFGPPAYCGYLNVWLTNSWF